MENKNINCYNETDLENIIKVYSAMISSICHRMIQNPEDAKDAAQEAWINILKGLPNFRGESELSTYIYKITYNTVMLYSKKDRIYSIRFLHNYFHGEQREIPCDLDYDKDIWIKEMCDKCLSGILHCIDYESRITYLLRDLVQISYEDIATIIGKDPVTVRKIVTRSRNKLKNFLQDECILFNPHGKCRCRMKTLVKDIKLENEYAKLRNFVKRVNIYRESQKILPQKKLFD